MLSQITFIVKTIHRPWACNRLITSIRRYAPGALIHVLDDGKPELRLSSNNPKTAASLDMLIEPGEFDIGVSSGRNRLVESVTTPYLVLLDDDHVLNESTKLVEMLDTLRRFDDRLDLLAFGLGYVPRCFAMHRATRTMYADEHSHAIEGNVHWCDLVPNAFLAKTEAMRRTRWDPKLKIYEHWDFFLRATGEGMRVAITNDHGVDHLHVNNLKYGRLRYRGRFKQMALKKHGLRYFTWQSSHV